MSKEALREALSGQRGGLDVDAYLEISNDAEIRDDILALAAETGTALRDAFAGLALPLVAERHSYPHATVISVMPEYYSALAADAYALADAMLKAREQ